MTCDCQMNYFDLFDLPKQYELDEQTLSARYHQLLQQFHPDKFVASPEKEQRLALQKAAQINDAYQTLSSSLRRAEYLLLIHGVELQNETHTFQDTEFLVQQMLLREELEEISSVEISDGSGDSALFDFADKVASSRAQLLQELIDALHLKQWLISADLIRKLKFFDKLQHEIERIEEKLLD